MLQRAHSLPSLTDTHAHLHTDPHLINHTGLEPVTHTLTGRLNMLPQAMQLHRKAKEGVKGTMIKQWRMSCSVCIRVYDLIECP